jgi:hypothetical protein
MTVKVVGQWERHWKSPMEEYNTWIHPLREFGIDDFYMCPISGISGHVKERVGLSEVFDENPDLTRVYIDESAEVKLSDFVHPENALYVIGKTSYSPFKTEFRVDIDKAVKIPSLRNMGGFWGDQALILILYDRFLKNGF